MLYIYIYMCMYVCRYIYIYIYIHVCLFVCLLARGRNGPRAGAPEAGEADLPPPPGPEAGGPRQALEKGQTGSALMGSPQISCARAYLFPQSVKIRYFCSGPISVDPTCPRPTGSRRTSSSPAARLSWSIITQ